MPVTLARIGIFAYVVLNTFQMKVAPMIKLLPIAAVGLVVSGPAGAQITFPAQGNAVPSSTPAAGSAPSKSNLICEYQDDTGSRVSRKKACYTPEEWQRIKAESRESIEKYQQQAKGPTSG